MSDSRPSVSRQRRRAQERARRKSGAALTLGAALAAVPAAHAATFTVGNLNDAGAGSLRQAIEDANGAAGADVIDFQAGLTGTITLATGQLEITDSVDIQGPGSASLTVNGNNASRVFYLYNGSALLDVTISGLTVTGGNDSVGGGIVDFDENLTLDDVTLTGNNATSDGGGLWADGFNMTLTIRDSLLSGNSAGADGGGIYIEDTGGLLLIQNTVITGNDAAGSGGGIYLYDPDADTTIEDSTISGNTAGEKGGGIYLYSPDDGTHTIRRTTISGNSAAAGGGLFFYDPDHPFVIENSTISGNSATAGNGGGIYLYNLYGSLAIRNSTIAGNTATGSGGGIFGLYGSVDLVSTIVGDNTAPTNPDLGGDARFDLFHSLIESPGTADIDDLGGSILNQDPQLGPLQNNGGPTETHLPAVSSPAFNAGDPAFAPPPATDQRGLPRVANGRLDIGSVEVAQLVAGTIQLTVSGVTYDENGVGTVTLTATRTVGSDGAVSVDFTTADGTAVAPADYLAAAGTLSWADGDSAPKMIQITIVDDSLDEADETFTVTVSNPQGGAVLGGNTTATVTIRDNDEISVVEVPTVGDVGRILLIGVIGLAGLLVLRRRQGVAASALILGLAAGELEAATTPKPPKPAKEQKAVLLTEIQRSGGAVVLRLSDGSTLQVPLDALEVQQQRRPVEVRGVQSLEAGQPLVVKVRRDRSGSVKKVKLRVFQTLEQARAAAIRDAG